MQREKRPLRARCVWMTDAEFQVISGTAARMALRGGGAISKSGVVRALVNALTAAQVDLSRATSEEDLTTRFKAVLLAGKAAGK